MAENDVYLVIETQGQPARRSRRHHPVLTPTPTPTPTPTSLDVDGRRPFTDLSPVPGYQAIYVANDGNNSDPGTIVAPLNSIAAAMAMTTDNTPYRIYLQCGDSWLISSRDLDALPSGHATEGMALFTYYGDTSEGRPIIMCDGEAYRNDDNDAHDIGFVGIEFYGHYKDPENAAYDATKGTPNVRFVGEYQTMLIEDCKFRYSRVTVQSYTSGDITYRPRNITIHRNIFDTTYVLDSSFERHGASNIFANGVYGGFYVNDNVFDYGGWHPSIPSTGANLLSHNVYLQHGSEGDLLEFNRNICSRGASHGVQMRSGGLGEDNFVARCSIGLLVGYNYGGREIPDGTLAALRWNVVSEGHSMWKGGGGDFCTAEDVCSRALWGLQITVNSDALYELTNNVVSGIYENNFDEVGFDGTYNQYAIKEDYDLPYVSSGNEQYKFSNDLEGLGEYTDPGRTLATYNQYIGGVADYDEFMDKAKGRRPGEWPEELTATEINKYIRAGFGKVKP